MKSRLRSAPLAILFVFFAGCGVQTYEQRLNETREYFEYRNKVDAALDKNLWQKFGLEMRIPVGFTEIPGPVEEGEHDRRQPPFLDRPLPGLMGAWEGNVRVDIPDSDVTEMKAWIFVCSNHDEWVAKLNDPLMTPETFGQRLSDTLADALRYERDTAVQPWSYDEVRCPSGAKAYVPLKNYRRIPLEHSVNLEGYGQVEMEFRFNRYDVGAEGEVQMALITAVPKAYDSREPIYRNVELAMETMTMSDEKPRSEDEAAPTTGGGF